MDKKNIMIKEFVKNVGNLYDLDMVAIYNSKNISEEEVTTIIQEEVENDHVIVVTKKQFDQVFGK